MTQGKKYTGSETKKKNLPMLYHRKTTEQELTTTNMAKRGR